MRKTITLLTEFSVALITGVIIALVWANMSPEGYFSFVDKPFAETHPLGRLSLHFITNELFMVLFFGMAAMEITRNCLPGGDLSPPRKAVNSLLSSLGGIIGPVAVFIALNSLFGSPDLNRGWGIPIATDIVLAWLVARIVFGSKHPVVTFLLLLAIVDDAIGLAIITFFHSGPHAPAAPLWLLLTFLGMSCAWIMRNLKLANYWPYLVIGGGLSWTGLYLANLHPSLALVFIAPFFPHPRQVREHLFDADLADRSALTDFQLEWKNIIVMGLFMFGLANGGVEFSQFGTATWLVLVSLIVGKTGGIFTLGWLGEKLGFPLPDLVGKKELFLAGMIGGIGLTVAFLTTGKVFDDAGIQGMAKMGALLSVGVALIALAAGRVLRVKRIH